MKSFLKYLRTGDIEEDSGEFIRRLHKMVLRAREYKECGEVPDELIERILSEKDEKILLVMLKKAAKAESVEQFIESLDN